MRFTSKWIETVAAAIWIGATGESTHRHREKEKKNQRVQENTPQAYCVVK